MMQMKHPASKQIKW